MTLRKFLVIPLIISAIFFIYFSPDVGSSLNTLLSAVNIDANMISSLLGNAISTIFNHLLKPYLLLAIALQITGHIVRAYKTKVLLDSVKESSTRFQFRALTIGYLFNTILPFRLGELIRTRIISAAMNLSFAFALTLIIFERAVDAIILGVAGMVIFFILGGSQQTAILPLAISLLVLGVVFIAGLLIVARPNIHSKKFCFSMSNVFNDKLRDSLRFKMWSIIYGLQRVLRLKNILQYVILSLTSWLLYGLSVLILAIHLLPQLTIGDKIVAAITPYFGISVPAGPADLGSFSNIVNSLLAGLHIGADNRLVYDLFSWAVLVMPIAVIGTVLLIFKTKETVWTRRLIQSSQVSLRDKLNRSEDISRGMAVFLENYFMGNTLSSIVHRLELTDNFRLLRYFKGGSDAITVLALQNEEEVVKKIIPIEIEARLRAQYDWLRKYRNVPGMVKALASETAENYYMIDLSYNKDDQAFFDYIHNHTIKKSKAIMASLWKTLDKHVHKSPRPLKLHTHERQAYLDRHVYGCLDKAAAVDPELARAAEPKIISINGRMYDNLFQILEKIKNHEQAWNDLASYRETATVHGDVIVDNLLVNSVTDKLLIIDPAPDGNIINGQVFDFGKCAQSLYCGYEFLLRDESDVYLREDNRIDYRDATSSQYEKLYQYISRELAPKYLSEAEQKAMLFHAASLFIRRLKHQVYYTPGNALKFYAVGVKTFNEFLEQYS